MCCTTLIVNYFFHSIAAHETTSTALAFTIWALAKYPDVQTKLREEVSTIAGEPTYDDLMDPNHLPYLDAVCKEAMRMFPPLSHTEKVVEEDDAIPLRHPIRGADGLWIKSIPVKKGQVIHIPLIGINRDEAVFGDADVFRPTRWLVGRGDAVESKYCTPGEHGIPPADQMCGGWSGLFTFSEGPRICVGMKLTLFEYKAIITTLTRGFQFHDTGVAISAWTSTTLSPHVKGRRHEGINLPVKLTLI
jgi:cytochrome P450